MINVYLSEPKEVYVERRTLLKESPRSARTYIDKHLHTANWLVFTVLRGSLAINAYNPADGRQITVLVLDHEVLNTFPRLDIWGSAHWVMKRQWFIHHWTSGSF